VEIEVLFFAALREKLGLSRLRCAVPTNVHTVLELRGWLAGRDAHWTEALAPERRIRVALDQRLVQDDAALHEGAEVAFFPPVTGG
jgi:molybdopterin synthase sulfur carrier subunit